MKLFKWPYYEFDHEAVAEYFASEFELSFVNEFCVGRDYYPVAVYRIKNPAPEDKEYLLLQTDSNTKHETGAVRSMTAEEIEPFRFQHGLHCLRCGDVIYSVMRHDLHACGCGEICVDGGRDYLRVLGPKSAYEMVVIDLLTDDVKLYVPEITEEKNPK